jgi:hypothetical protein
LLESDVCFCTVPFRPVARRFYGATSIDALRFILGKNDSAAVFTQPLKETGGSFRKRLAYTNTNSVGVISERMYMTVTCSEFVTKLEEREIALSTLIGFD